MTDPKRLAQRMIAAAEDPEKHEMPQPPGVDATEEERETYAEAWRIYQAHHETDEEERVRLTAERVKAENAAAEKRA